MPASVQLAYFFLFFLFLSALEVLHPSFSVEVNRDSPTHSQTLTDVHPDLSVTDNTET